MTEQTKAVATAEAKAPVAVAEKPKPLAVGVVPTSMEEVVRIARYISRSELAPKDYRGKEDNCIAAILMGSDLGLKPMQAVRYIAVINGRPSVWGDGLLAIVMNHRDFGGIREELLPEDQPLEKQTAVCRVVRKGVGEIERTFSWADAVKAKLTTKQGTWQEYPKRMLQMRARGFACRDAFPDALIGLSVGEEAQDMPPKVINPEGGEFDPAAELESRDEFRQGAEDVAQGALPASTGGSKQPTLLPDEEEAENAYETALGMLELAFEAGDGKLVALWTGGKDKRWQETLQKLSRDEKADLSTKYEELRSKQGAK